MPKPGFEINRNHNRGELRKIFQQFGRVHIPDFLDLKSANSIYKEISNSIDWKLSIGNNGTNLDYDYAEFQKQDPDDINKFQNLLRKSASEGFQYCFKTYRLSEKINAKECHYEKLNEFFRFINSPQFLIFMRNLTGVSEGIYCDAQVTNFTSGDFLTQHHDENSNKGRIAAFVYNLTPIWRPDWGGLLQFIGKDNHITEAYTPCFNALNILKVPQNHSVSFVAPYAIGKRLSITGWFRIIRD